MKRLLVKIAHIILKKYGLIPLDVKDKVLFNGKVYEVQRCELTKEYFKTELKIEMCDCLKFVDKNGNPI